VVRVVAKIEDRDLAEGAGCPIRNFNQRGSAGVSIRASRRCPGYEQVYAQLLCAHPRILEFVSFPECSRKRKEKRQYLEKFGGDDGVRTRDLRRDRPAF
jgi:hypothetical protein